MRNVFAFVLLLTWLAFGAWFYTCKIQNLCGERIIVKKETVIQPIEYKEKTAPKPAIEIIEPEKLKEAYKSIFSAEADLAFKESEEKIAYTNQFNNSLDEIADFLKKHPQTNLTITGYYARKEVNESAYPNLGMSRGEQVKALIVAKGVPSKQLLINAKEQPDLFDENGNASGDGVIDFKYSEAYEELNETDVKAAYKALFLLQKECAFNKNDKDVILTDRLEKQIQNVVYYLNRNKDQGLDIKVMYEKEESSGLSGQNIGLLRAYNFKQKLVAKGIDPERMTIGSKPNMKVFDNRRRSLPNMMQFNFIFPDKADEAKLAELQLERDLERALSSQTSLKDEDKTSQREEISEDGKPLAPEIIFSFGSEHIRANKDLKKYVDRLQDFLQKYPQKRVFIIGHTCNIGEENMNYALGLRRADAAKMILVKEGVDKLKVITDSRGETVPAYPNKTSKDRSRNRRVEIDIQ